MGKNSKLINKTNGLLFYKFLGTGGSNGFSLWPDWSTYALLTTWKNEEDAKKFISNSQIISLYKQKVKSIRLLTLESFKSHGNWDGINPFESNNSNTILEKKKIAIITRATLNWSKLFAFWKSVPHSSTAIKEAKGVLYYKGIGELPFIQQATISIWNSLDDVLNFAYNSKKHADIIKKTRKEKWYKEELFSRFIILEDKQIF
jgi:heme-degrading monooxygenase HmoA